MFVHSPDWVFHEILVKKSPENDLNITLYVHALENILHYNIFNVNS